MIYKDLKKIVQENSNFRKVLYTGKKCQLVVMNIPVGEDIGTEVHPHTDQILIFISGKCKATIGAESNIVTKK